MNLMFESAIRQGKALPSFVARRPLSVGCPTLQQARPLIYVRSQI